MKKGKIPHVLLLFVFSGDSHRMRGRSIGATVDIFIGLRSYQLRVRNVRNIHCHPTGSEKKGKGKGINKRSGKDFSVFLMDVLKSTIVLIFY